MFNKVKPKTYDQDAVDGLTNRIFSLKRSIKEREEFLNSAQRNASVVIDWNAFNCISVERVKYEEDGIPKTILTSLRDGSTHEFSFFVSDEKHEDIAEQFREHLENRK